MKKLLYLLILNFIAINLFGQTTEKRLALIIGNSQYQNGGALKNPVNDANLMATTLQSMGFDVKKLTNGTLKQMQLATADFTNNIKEYKVALFYYAGHGIQVDGHNYLIPVDAKMDNATMTKFEALDINFVNDAFLLNQDNINIMILDACRNDPFRAWARGGERGFKKIDQTAKGSIIGYATQPGATAADGTGQNGLYTAMLVEQMKKSQDIEDVFKNTRIAVNSASTDGQLPQEWSSLMGNFYFVKPGNTTASNYSSNTSASGLVIGSVESDYGGILIDTELGGQLYIDGTFMGNLPANSKGNRLTQQSTGSHSVKIIGNNETKTEIVTVYKNNTARVNITSSKHEGGSTLYDSRDGKTYKTVKIGSQVWMAENLNYSAGSGSRYYDDNSSNGSKYGKLYDWETAKKVCPTGWHLPSKTEFETLLQNNGGEASYSALIENGNSGFNALFGGYRFGSGKSLKMGSNGLFWSSSEHHTVGAWNMSVHSYEARMTHTGLSVGLSVRCLKD